MAQPISIDATTTMRPCTPCSLGIHSCCHSRERTCYCMADSHPQRNAGAGPGLMQGLDRESLHQTEHGT